MNIKMSMIFVICLGIATAFAGGTATLPSTATQYQDISIIHNPSEADLAAIDVEHWPTWRKEVSDFNWQFSEDETAYLMEGEVLVKPVGDKGVGLQIKKGDLVTFKAGLYCNWVVKKDVYKHFYLTPSFFGHLYWRFMFNVDSVIRHIKAFFNVT